MARQSLFYGVCVPSDELVEVVFRINVKKLIANDDGDQVHRRKLQLLDNGCEGFTCNLVPDITVEYPSNALLGLSIDLPNKTCYLPAMCNITSQIASLTRQFEHKLASCSDKLRVFLSTFDPQIYLGEDNDRGEDDERDGGSDESE